jgi:hypothetical protein
VPISDLRKILETLANLAGRNLGIIESAEALRPGLAGLLIQQIAPLNQPLPVITLSSELEHMLISMSRQSNDGGLLLDSGLAERLIKSLHRPVKKHQPMAAKPYLWSRRKSAANYQQSCASILTIWRSLASPNCLTAGKSMSSPPSAVMPRIKSKINKIRRFCRHPKRRMNNANDNRTSRRFGNRNGRNLGKAWP